MKTLIGIILLAFILISCKKQIIDSSDNIITYYRQDGSIEMIAKGSFIIFKQDVNGNVGIGTISIDPLLHLYPSNGSIEVITTGRTTKIYEPGNLHKDGDPIGNSKPMKRLNINDKCTSK